MVTDGPIVAADPYGTDSAAHLYSAASPALYH